jgi:t-SNARE complex subunit (syntaxin)
METTVASVVEAFRPIREALADLERGVAVIQQLEDELCNVVVEDKRRGLQKQLSEEMERQSQVAQRIRNDLAAQERLVQGASMNTGAIHQIRLNMLQQNQRHFRTVMATYVQLVGRIEKTAHERAQRALLIVDPSTDVMLVNDEEAAYRAVQAELVDERLDRTTEAVEARHLAIVNLEQQCREILHLFRDLQVLVTVQGETLDVIERRVANARDHTAGGNEELVGAEGYQRKARRRLCCIVAIAVAVVSAIIFIPLAALNRI